MNTAINGIFLDGDETNEIGDNTNHPTQNTSENYKVSDNGISDGTINDSDARQSRLSVDEENEEGFNPVKGEIFMWRAVVAQALIDARSQSAKRDLKKKKGEAIEWLHDNVGDNAGDFDVVCEYAGLNPDFVRERTKKLSLEKGEIMNIPSKQNVTSDTQTHV